MKTLLQTCALFILTSTFISAAMATTVQFQTVAGDFEVNLFDQDTPETVDNFLQYVSEGLYEDTIFHRSVENFVIQGGGFNLTENVVDDVTPFPSVINEPVFSNVRGTIAMAKQNNRPNSATSQWFFNLKDNSANLDVSNSGYSVFGVVTGNGMAILDTLADWPTYAFRSPFGELPLRDYTQDDYTGGTTLVAEHYALIYNIVVLDADEDTAASLSPEPVRNTAIDEQTNDQDGGGGSSSFLFLVGLFGLYIVRKKCVQAN